MLEHAPHGASCLRWTTRWTAAVRRVGVWRGGLQLDQLGEVGERPRQPVNLVDDDHVDLAGPDIVQQLLERRPLHRTSREAAIVIAFADKLPSLMGLALDVSHRGFALVVEGVEVLFQTIVGGDARVDGAAKGVLALDPFHRRTSWTA